MHYYVTFYILFFFYLQQEDCEKKILSRPGVQTMFLASGAQIQSQQQNLVLPGNEVAAKILQNRKYSAMTTSSISSNVSTNIYSYLQFNII